MAVELRANYPSLTSQIFSLYSKWHHLESISKLVGSCPGWETVHPPGVSSNAQWRINHARRKIINPSIRHTFHQLTGEHWGRWLPLRVKQLPEQMLTHFGLYLSPEMSFRNMIWRKIKYQAVFFCKGNLCAAQRLEASFPVLLPL